jgi:hypothetical protein
MAGNQLVDDQAMAGEGGQGGDLVLLHVPAVALDVGGEDGDELAFETGLFHQGLLRA